MAIFQTKPFVRFASRHQISDGEICQMAVRIASGRWDADLGGGVVKQRLARAGGGKSGGFRALILFKPGSHIFLIDVFAKNRRANLEPRELTGLRQLAGLMLAYSDRQLSVLQARGELIEVICHEQD